MTCLAIKTGEIMDEEEWEVIPHKILADLRDEVHALKEKISQPSTKKDMVDSMIDLKRSVDQMHSIFKIALETTEKDSNSEMLTKLLAIEKQNEQIAQALVTVADFVEKQKKSEMSMQFAQPLPSEPMRMPMPAMPPPLPQAPRSPPRMTMPSLAPRAEQMLPPPPPAPPKKGFFGLKK